MPRVFLLVLAAVQGLAAAAVAGPAGWEVYRAPAGWSISYPAGWEVAGSGPAAAFLAPPVRVSGASFRPSLVVSVSRVDRGTPAERVVEVARAAFERATPGVRLLGQETVQAASDQISVLYYHSPPDRGMPGLYFVLGVAVRDQLYVMLGTTSTALQDYRQQAAVFRAMMASLRVARVAR